MTKTGTSPLAAATATATAAAAVTAAAAAAASWRWITLTEHRLIYALVRRRYKNVTCQKMCLLLQIPKINRCDHKQSTFKHRGRTCRKLIKHLLPKSYHRQDTTRP
jgi:hypothetical protein